MNKPREWWIGFPDGQFPEVFDECDAESGCVHVIEKSAYDDVVRERDELAEAKLFEPPCPYCPGFVELTERLSRALAYAKERLSRSTMESAITEIERMERGE